MKMSMEIDPVLEGLTQEELKDTVVRNLREINRIKEDAKAYAKSTKEMVKELERRNEEAVGLIGLAPGAALNA